MLVFAVLAWWERRAQRRGGDPLLKPDLLGQPSFSAGAVFAIVYFAGFTSVFFTLSILWQAGLAHSALVTGLVMLPFSLGSLVSAANSDKLSARLGRMVLITGCTMVATGLALVTLSCAVHLPLRRPSPDGWSGLAAPLLLAGLGSGMVHRPEPGLRAGSGTAA